VTLSGNTIVSRMGGSVQAALGQAQHVAVSVPDYGQKVVAALHDSQWRAAGRASAPKFEGKVMHRCLGVDFFGL